jgi:hypothetical protein
LSSVVGGDRGAELRAAGRSYRAGRRGGAATTLTLFLLPVCAVVGLVTADAIWPPVFRPRLSDSSWPAVTLAVFGLMALVCGVGVWLVARFAAFTADPRRRRAMLGAAAVVTAAVAHGLVLQDAVITARPCETPFHTNPCPPP